MNLLGLTIVLGTLCFGATTYAQDSATVSEKAPVRNHKTAKEKLVQIPAPAKEIEPGEIVEKNLEKDIVEMEVEQQKLDNLQHKIHEEVFAKASKDEALLAIAREVYPYAQMSHVAYSFKNEPIEGFTRFKKEELPTEWQQYYVEKNNSLSVSNVAFTAIVFHRNDQSKEIIVALKGTELRAFMTLPDKNTMSNLSKFAKNAMTAVDFKVLGNLPEHFKKAQELVEELQKRYPDSTITLTGSSLAGAVAQYVALLTNRHAYIFNSLQISESQVEEIKKVDPTRIDKASELVTVISLEGDSVSTKYPIVSKEYLGREFEIPYYTDHWIPYYASIHHTTDPILTSLDAIINNQRKVYYCSSFSASQCQGDEGCVWNPKGAKGYQCLSKQTSWCSSAVEKAACEDLGCNWTGKSCLSRLIFTP